MPALPTHRQSRLPVGLSFLGAALALGWLAACDAGGADPGAATRAGPSVPVEPGEWPAYGRDPGGTRFSPLVRIRRDNVGDLEVAWTYRTGEAPDDPDHEAAGGGGCADCHSSDARFEVTPLMVGGTLYLSTPVNRVVALDPATGEQQWVYDSQANLDLDYSEGFISRGVSYWTAGTGGSDPCLERIFLGTIDARLVALDASTGSPCADFGEAGQLRLDQDVGRVDPGDYMITSPPAVAGDVIVVGSAIGDNRRAAVERGIVRGFHARTGERLWAWDPIPRSPEHPAWSDWTPEAAEVTGAANAWAPLSADPERDLVFVPTGSAAPDFYGGQRTGSNLFANSVVALRASTGEVVWHFQVVHHDLWDYDVPAQPSLITVPRDGQDVPAVAVGTKMGHLFVLHRETGEPLFPVEERPVPPSQIPGEEAWPTQPFPVVPPPLIDRPLTPDMAYGVTEEGRRFCQTLLGTLWYEGPFTPPSTQGTLLWPGIAGGMNWGSMAWDPTHNLVVTTLKHIPFFVRLHPREEFAEARRQGQEGVEFAGQQGTPFGMSRAPLIAPDGTPCSPPPWGTLIAVDTDTGVIVWEVPLGTVPEPELHPAFEGDPDLGTLPFGGPMITAGGLVFVAATMDDHFRAFDVETGRKLWDVSLPAGGQATPMTYETGGRQYVVIAAGGREGIGTPGDYVIAYALPEG
jgi:quinoprotein glucose dehydrogenase